MLHEKGNEKIKGIICPQWFYEERLPKCLQNNGEEVNNLQGEHKQKVTDWPACLMVYSSQAIINPNGLFYMQKKEKLQKDIKQARE